MIYFDHGHQTLLPVRQWLNVAAAPVLFLAALPSRVLSTASQIMMSHNYLLQENAQLQANNLILEQKVQKLASLTAQNMSLRELLNSSELVNEQVLVSEVVGIDPDPFRHRLVINKGSTDRVYPGQAVLDAFGIIGQVIEVSPVSSKVLMLTDSTSRIPVQNNRTKYRAIAAGNGRTDYIELLHIPVTEEFKKGDLLTTSGLGGTYPEGYPVGEVINIRHYQGDPFVSIEIRPLAEVNRSKFLLLVFRETSS